MDAYLVKKATKMNFFHVVLACSSPPLVDPAFFVLRKVQRDQFGVIKKHPTMNFNLTEKMSQEDRLKFPVYRGATPKHIHDSFESSVASTVMSIKGFMNENAMASFFHDTTIESRPQYGLKSSCFQRNDVHFHFIVKSTAKTAKDLPDFRKLKRKVEKCDGVLKSHKIKESSVSQVYNYNLRDPEKVFLGCNDPCMLTDIEAVHEDLTIELPSNVLQYLDDDCITQENEDIMNYVRNMNKELKRKNDDDDAGEGTSYDADCPGVGSVDRTQSSSLKKKKFDNVHTKKLKIIEDALDLFGFCTSLDELVKNSATEDFFSSILQVYAQPGSDKLFSVAKANHTKKSSNKKSMDHIKNLVVSNEGKNKYMTPEQTLAIFNAWCEEQNINAHELAFVLKTRLNQMATKKIGIYLHGQTGSGKTFWTAGLFTPLKNHVGKLTSGGRFMFQECNGKSIVIGEEVGITTDNVDRFKEPMSGVEIPVEIKNKQNGRCHADIVLMNSNVMPGANVPGELPNLKTRMFIYTNLHQRAVLKKAVGLPNITFLNLVRDPTEEECEQLNQNCLEIPGDVSDIKSGRTYKFNGEWEDLEVTLLSPETPTSLPPALGPDAPKRITTSLSKTELQKLDQLLAKNYSRFTGDPNLRSVEKLTYKEGGEAKEKDSKDE